MASWVHVFSKFTPEALLFEALLICVLCAGYAGFWVLRKRRYGVMGKDHPNYAVKSYLSQLILDAEQMRIQLFGLLAGTGFDPNLMAQMRGAQLGAAQAPSGTLSAVSASALAADPALAAKLAAIEAKMGEQTRAMDAIIIEKNRIEKELIEARSGKGGAAAAGGAPDPAMAEKLKSLEAKLAEYSVIEDDLANLKRLQQENAALRAQLGGKAPTATAPAAAAAPAVAELAAIAPAATPADTEAAAAAEAAAATDASLAEAAAAPAAAEEVPAELVSAPTADPAFEGLVDQVEKSLAEPATGATSVDPTAEAPAAPIAEVAQVAAPAASHSPAEKSDADLVAEFEKMLNS